MAFKCTLVLKDDMNRTVRKTLETTEALLADAQTAVEAYLVDLAVVSDLGVVSATYTEKDATVATSPAEDSNVDIGATFKVRLPDGNLAPHKIPGFSQGFAGSGGSIDVEQSEIQAYFDNFLTGASLRLSDGEYIVDVEVGEMDK
jgi:hypothetical protein